MPLSFWSISLPRRSVMSGPTESVYAPGADCGAKLIVKSGGSTCVMPVMAIAPLGPVKETCDDVNELPRMALLNFSVTEENGWVSCEASVEDTTVGPVESIAKEP